MPKDRGTFVRLDEEERRTLEALCRAEERNMSDILRRALRRYAGQADAPKPLNKEEIVGRWLLSLPAEVLDVLDRLLTGLLSASPESRKSPGELHKLLGIGKGRRKKGMEGSKPPS